MQRQCLKRQTQRKQMLPGVPSKFQLGFILSAWKGFFFLFV